MQEELKRIKNKDLKSLDDRLFGNLDKVETINSTIQNLGQFQQFLLKQISQFEEKAKTKHKSKEVAEVIELNCLTLRESIMNVMPDDLEGSRSRLREAVASPINGFRSTRVGFKKEVMEHQSFRVHENREGELERKMKELEEFKILSIKREEELKQQLAKAQTDWKQTTTQIEGLRKYNATLKEQIKRLKEQHSKLLQKITEADTVKQKNIQQLFSNPLHLSTQLTATQHMPVRSSQLKEEAREQQYLSFKDKMKFDFTSKLHKYQDSQLKAHKDLQDSQNAQASDTFRQSHTIELNAFDSTYESHNPHIQSIDIGRTPDCELDPNVPKLLKRDSISAINHLCNISQQNLSSKHRIPLSSYDSNLAVRSQYQSAQKTIPPRHESTSKKSNHEMMRKTKSNFFKGPLENKENQIILSDAFYDTNIAKMKGLVSQSNPNERKRNSQSKQKLKIFSMM